MKIDPSIIALLASSLVLIGLLIQVAALAPLFSLISMLSTRPLRQRWFGMAGLIIVFIAGYIGYIVVLWGQQAKWSDLPIPGIFLFGSIFVWMTIRLSLQTATDLQRVCRLEEAAQAGVVGIWDWDVVNNKLVWDKVMYQLYGLRESDFGGAYEAWVSALHPEDKEFIKKEVQAALRGESEYAPEFRIVWPDRSIHYIKAASHTTFDEQGKPLRMVGVNYDLTKQKYIQHELNNLAFYDRLTSLPNRRLLDDRLEQSIARAKRDHHKMALLFIDLDKFKPVNDLHGHEVGDLLLKQVAVRIQKCLRASDTVARRGGDEFVVLLLAADTVAEAIKVAEKIRATLEQPFVIGDCYILNISCSIGVAIYPDHADNASELMLFGDEAMYKAKKGGGNAVAVFSLQA